jgi:AcrR family transcriptional regulator
MAEKRATRSWAEGRGTATSGDLLQPESPDRGPGRQPPKRAGKPLGRPKLAAGGHTRESILDAAIRVFADRGLGGARIKAISKAARCNDRMIYYYFGSKEKLFVEVLKTIYQQMTDAERDLSLDLSDPVAALRRLVRFTMEHYLKHPEMVTLLNNENLHRGRYVSKAKSLKRLSSPALEQIDAILRKGVEAGVFRSGIEPLQLYLAILALNYFYVSNHWTLSAFLGRDLMAEQEIGAWQDWVWNMVEKAVAC